MIAKAGIIALASIVLVSMTLVDDDEVLEVAKLRLSIGRTRTMIGVGNELESHELFVIVQNVSVSAFSRSSIGLCQTETIA